MTIKPAILGTAWLAGITAVAAAMLACMLTHIIKNRITIGRWWT